MSDTNDPANQPVEPTPEPPEPTAQQPMQGADQPPAAPPVYGQQPDYSQSGYNQPAYDEQGYGQPPMRPDGVTSDEMTWGGVAHWGALVTGVLIGGMAFLAPLIVMLTKGGSSAYVRTQAVESLNFQLSVLIYAIVSAVLLIVLIGFVLLPIVAVFWLVYTIIGSIRASRGEVYHYPLTIRMVS